MKSFIITVDHRSVFSTRNFERFEERVFSLLVSGSFKIVRNAPSKVKGDNLPQVRKCDVYLITSSNTVTFGKNTPLNTINNKKNVTQFSITYLRFYDFSCTLTFLHMALRSKARLTPSR